MTMSGVILPPGAREVATAITAAAILSVPGHQGGTARAADTIDDVKRDLRSDVAGVDALRSRTVETQS